MPEMRPLPWVSIARRCGTFPGVCRTQRGAPYVTTREGGVLSKVEKTTCGGGAKPRRKMGARQCRGRKLQCFALLLALAGHRGSAEEETPLASVFATSKTSTAAVSPLQANLTAYQQKDAQVCLRRFHVVFMFLTFKLRARLTSVRISQASRVSQSLTPIREMT